MNLSRILHTILLAAVTAGLFTCDKPTEEKAEGRIEFGMALNLTGQDLKSGQDDSARVENLAVIVTLGNHSGELVLNNERLELYNFGGKYVTKEIKLRIGSYKLLKFMVIDDKGNVRFAAPIYNAPLAYLVKHPLPIRAEVEKDKVTRLIPEVLPVDNTTPPEAFGYISFGFNVVHTLEFFIAAYIDDPRIMAPTMPTAAMLTVRISTGWSHSFKLEPKINRITVPLVREKYMLIVRKEGFQPQILEKSYKELLEATREHPILVPLKKEHIVILRPGPEKGKDATIFLSKPDQNFGIHPYFEAASSPPYVIHDHVEASRSLIMFNLKELPKNARIGKAFLSLYYKTPYFYEGIDERYMSENLAVFQKIITPWEEHEVTWNKQPETTEVNQVFLKPMPWISANFYTIDVTAIIQDLRNHPEDLHGIMFRLIKEKNVSGFIFGSSDHPEKEMHPTLRLHMLLPVQVADPSINTGS
jgi:hypothetical protein